MVEDKGFSSLLSVVEQPFVGVEMALSPRRLQMVEGYYVGFYPELFPFS